MTEFTPFASLGGGILIGAASVMLMATLGRIMGATGILAGFLQPSSKSEWLWRAMVLLGMISGPIVMRVFTGSFPELEVPVTTGMMILGGFLVGIGVTYGSGCTSGHGVCGIARFSTRSIVATVIFMITTFITVFVVRHILGL